MCEMMFDWTKFRPTVSHAKLIQHLHDTPDIAAIAARLQRKLPLGVLVAQEAFLLDSCNQLAVNKQCRRGIMADSAGDAGDAENIHDSVTRFLLRVISVNIALISGHAPRLRATGEAN